MMASTAAEAKEKVPLTPELRLGIAKAVIATQPLLPLLSNTVLNSEISAAKDQYEQNAYHAYYCVRLVIERPLLNYHGVFAVYPFNAGGGRYEFNTRWKNNKTLPECEPEHELNPFPELRALVERRPM